MPFECDWRKFHVFCGELGFLLDRKQSRFFLFSGREDSTNRFFSRWVPEPSELEEYLENDENTEKADAAGPAPVVRSPGHRALVFASLQQRPEAHNKR